MRAANPTEAPVTRKPSAPVQGRGPDPLTVGKYMAVTILGAGGAAVVVYVLYSGFKKGGFLEKLLQTASVDVGNIGHTLNTATGLVDDKMTNVATILEYTDLVSMIRKWTAPDPRETKENAAVARSMPLGMAKMVYQGLIIPVGGDTSPYPVSPFHLFAWTKGWTHIKIDNVWCWVHPDAREGLRAGLFHPYLKLDDNGSWASMRFNQHKGAHYKAYHDTGWRAYECVRAIYASLTGQIWGPGVWANMITSGDPLNQPNLATKPDGPLPAAAYTGRDVKNRIWISDWISNAWVKLKGAVGSGMVYPYRVGTDLYLVDVLQNFDPTAAVPCALPTGAVRDFIDQSWLLFETNLTESGNVEDAWAALAKAGKVQCAGDVNVYGWIGDYLAGKGKLDTPCWINRVDIGRPAGDFSTWNAWINSDMFTSDSWNKVASDATKRLRGERG